MTSYGAEQGASGHGSAGAEFPDPANRVFRAGRLHKARSRLKNIIPWGITFGLLAGAALRILCRDALDPLLWFNAFTPYVYLPAYVVFIFAVWQRRWLMAAANLLLILCHVLWVAPDFRPATPYPASAPVSEALRPVRIFSANIRAENPDHEGVLREIASRDPDVIVLIEYRRWWTHSLRESSVLKSYPYGTDLNQPYTGEIAVFSRLPISKQQIIWLPDHMNNVVDIPLRNTSLRLFCLHSPRPIYEKPFGYGEFWSKELPLISQQPRPLVVIGDFNATQSSRVYQELMATGLRSAHSDRGRGYATTWPNGDNPLPPIRIDQALLSPQVECLGVAEGIGYGSDHKPLIVDIRVHEADRASATASADR
jgi:endonuclease/exonuclease/phosphatase (EEP) superfamily protein YafD